MKKRLFALRSTYSSAPRAKNNRQSGLIAISSLLMPILSARMVTIPAAELVFPVLQSFVLVDGRGFVEGTAQPLGALPTYKNDPCQSPTRHLVGGS